MICNRQWYTIALCVVMVLVSGVWATRLVSVTPVDEQFLLVSFSDGEVRFKDDGQGESAFEAHGHFMGQDTLQRFGAALNTTASANPSSWTLSSTDDPAYKDAGAKVVAIYRKSKLNGMSEGEWNNATGWDYLYDYTLAHQLFLKLPTPLVQGKTYSLAIASATNSDKSSATFTFDIFKGVSEAIHVNLVGYSADNPAKAVDLYLWMGDGGARDYSSYVNKSVYLYNTETKNSLTAGKLALWKSAGSDLGGHNLTMSTVWSADCQGAVSPGRYRVVVEGIGASQEFTIAEEIYRDPFIVSLKGFYYMRIGEPKVSTLTPVPRQPRWIPQSDPVSTRVIRTSMHPYHAQWKTFSSGDAWDNPDDWAAFAVAGAADNNNAVGGHSDALDWDRHLGHVSIIYDLLLPFVLTRGALDDDATGIAESGNGIPDILDEAQNEVDFWLRLRDGKGYSHGLTNPNKDNKLFQAGTTALAAWANAANAAMLADCFRIAGKSALAQRYSDSAAVAYAYALTLNNQMVDSTLDIGTTTVRGRDLKMTAAAFLFNVTNQKKYEDVVKQESRCTTESSEINDYHWVAPPNADGYWTGGDQLWATVGYLFCPHASSYPQLLTNMQASLINEAKIKEANNITSRPSRRATDGAGGYIHSIQNVQRTLAAHAIAKQGSDKELLLKALYLEADWGLGRNPLNMIQMTTASTPLQSKRSVENMYTSGRNDGSPGLHPGHTPYMNMWDWDGSMVMGSPSWMQKKCYPNDFANTWPRAESYFNTRYVWANAEFTPQQTLRGKIALYAYLYGIGKKTPSAVIGGGVQPHSGMQSSLGLRSPTAVVVFDISGRVVAKFETDQHFVQWKHSLAQHLSHRLLIVQRADNTGRVERAMVSF